VMRKVDEGKETAGAIGGGWKLVQLAKRQIRTSQE